MPVDDLSDPGVETRRLKRRVDRLEAGVGASASGDSDHPGTGIESIQIGTAGVASGYAAVAFGDHADATEDYGIAVGSFAEASGQQSTAVGKSATAQAYGAVALGRGAYAPAESATALGSSANAYHVGSTAVGAGADTTADDEVMLGTAAHTVVVPGTFVNPSARRLKQNITPVPDAPGVFPELVEYEKRAAPGVRHLGYIADDLIGTDAERFLVLDGDGAPAGIAYLDLHTAQIVQLLARLERAEARIAELETNNCGGCA